MEEEEDCDEGVGHVLMGCDSGRGGAGWLLRWRWGMGWAGRLGCAGRAGLYLVGMVLGSARGAGLLVIAGGVNANGVGDDGDGGAEDWEGDARESLRRGG